MLNLTLRRCLSSSAVAGQLVKTPVGVHGVEGRYASALYSAASKEKKLEAVESQLGDLKELFDSHAQFRQFVLDPTLKKTDKKGAIEAILKKMGQDQINVNFFGVVAENGRLGKLDAIVKSFHTIMAAHRGEVECVITSAKPLDDAMSKQLEGVLKTFLQSGQTIKLTKKVNPAIVGGLVVNIGDKYVDMSIASKVQHYHDLIAQAV